MKTDIESVRNLKILVTGSAGFIGSFLTKKLLSIKHTVVGLDNLNSYYNPKLKDARLKLLSNEKNLSSFMPISQIKSSLWIYLRKNNSIL